MKFLWTFFLVAQGSGMESEPVDLILTKGERESFVADELSSELMMDSVTLQKESVLELKDFQNIHIRKLIVEEGAKILLAVPQSGRDGGAGVDGGNGASAAFFFDEIHGHLLIEARGGDGGDGRHGRHGRQGLTGGKGQDGRKLFWFVYLDRGERGQTGLPGENGEDGEDGGDGGHGGRIQIFYQQKTPDSQMAVDVSGGAGGRPGQGGRGGLGGMGGPGGKGWPDGAQGLMGRSGKSGRSGQPGRPGDSGQVEIYQVDSELYHCLLAFDFLENEINEGEWRRCVEWFSS